MNLDSVVEDLRISLREEDKMRIYSSSFCPLYRNWMRDGPEGILNLPVGLRTNRLWFQVRVMNERCNSMFWNGVAHKFSSEETCKICSSGKADTLEHFISECSALQGFRKNFNLLNPECDSNVCSLSELVTCSDSGVFLRFMRYLKAVLNARAFALA